MLLRPKTTKQLNSSNFYKSSIMQQMSSIQSAIKHLLSICKETPTSRMDHLQNLAFIPFHVLRASLPKCYKTD